MTTEQEKTIPEAPKVDSWETTIETTKQELASAYVDFLDKQKGWILATAAGFGANFNPLKQEAVDYLLNTAAPKTKKAGTAFEQIIANVEKNLDNKAKTFKKETIEKVTWRTISEYDQTSLNNMKALIIQYKDDQTKLQELMAQIQDGTDPTLDQTIASNADKTANVIEWTTVVGAGAGVIATWAVVENYDKSKYKDPVETNNAKITSKFGKRKDPVTWKENVQHNGIDISAPKSTPIHSIVAGKVIEKKRDSNGWGNYISIQWDDGRVYSYLHMKESSDLKAGDMVKAGDKIGDVGSTGKSTWPHLHISVKENNKPVDPMAALPEVFDDYKMVA